MRPAVILAVVAVALAGCAEHDNGVGPASASATTAPAPAASADQGSIDVSVLTDELQPVPGAQIVIVDSDFTAFTDEAGKATFNGIGPGDYTLVASKPAFETSQSRGILTKVVAGEIATVRFVLNPINVVTAESSFHRVIPIKGFISCSVNFGISGNLDQCGKGVTVNGQTYGGDPNDNSVHTYPIESAQIQQIFSEVIWKPTNDALSSKMRVWNYPSRQLCSSAPGSGYCYMSPFGGRGGAAPVLWNVTEGKDENITKSLQSEAKSIGKQTPYPRTFGLFVEPVINKPADANVGYAITYQQGYDVYMSVFYGLPAPPGYSALPPP